MKYTEIYIFSNRVSLFSTLSSMTSAFFDNTNSSSYSSDLIVYRRDLSLSRVDNLDLSRIDSFSFFLEAR